MSRFDHFRIQGLCTRAPARLFRMRAGALALPAAIRGLAVLSWGFFLTPAAISAPNASLPPLKVSADGRHLTVQGKPLLLLGDTVWLAQQRMTQSQVRTYLDHRKAQGFRAIGMQMDFGWSEGGRDVNGHCPYLSENGTALNPDYWEYTSWIVNEAARRGLYVFLKASAMEVRDYQWCMGGRGIRSVEDAYSHGRLLGEWFGRRGQMSNLVWMMSYDRTIEPDSAEAARMRAQAEGIADGFHGLSRFDGRANYQGVFMTFHPAGPGASAAFHSEPWLAAAGVQLRHRNYNDVALIAREVRRLPRKPVLNLEPRYEEAANAEEDPMVRSQAWLTFLHGGAAFIYGHWKVWRARWADLQSAWNSRSVSQLRFLVQRLEQWQWWRLQPDMSVFGDSQADPAAMAAGASADQILVYVRGSRPFRVSLKRFRRPVAAVQLNPADNTAYDLGIYQPRDNPEFHVPPGWQDVVILLREASRMSPPRPSHGDSLK